MRIENGKIVIRATITTASAFKNSWVGFSRPPDAFAALSFTEIFA